MVNNGNVASISNCKDSTRSQSFTYDELNRIKTAQSAATWGTNCWGDSFGYDIWANLLTKTVTKCTAETLSVTVSTKNQITTRTGILPGIPVISLFSQFLGPRIIAASRL